MKAKKTNDAITDTTTRTWDVAMIRILNEREKTTNQISVALHAWWLEAETDEETKLLADALETLRRLGRYVNRRRNLTMGR